MKDLVTQIPQVDGKKYYTDADVKAAEALIRETDLQIQQRILLQQKADWELKQTA